jgi:hypothetical protein
MSMASVVICVASPFSRASLREGTLAALDRAEFVGELPALWCCYALIPHLIEKMAQKRAASIRIQ